MIVVSDTSPLSNLFLVQHLNLLPAIFGEVIIPEKVFSELLILESDFGHDLTEIKTAPWLEIRTVHNLAAVARLRKDLDAGESEAIILAKELHADFLLIDEHEGRLVAASEGIRVIGVLGILVQAKAGGLLRLVKPVMDDLRTIAKFRISEKLYQFILEQVGE